MAIEHQRGSSQWRGEMSALQRKLDRCLDGMADHEFAGPNEVAKAAADLCEVYADEEFRHRYSNIAGILEKSALDSVVGVANKEALRKLETEIDAEQARATCLTTNLRALITYDPSGPDKIDGDELILRIQRDRRLEKLYDHVSLEAKRLGYDAGQIRMMIMELNNAQGLLSDTKRRLEEAENSADEAKEKAASLQRETIAILGVFSAITLAFNAGISFTTSSLAELNTVAPNIFQVAFVVAVVGFFLLNILYASFAFVHRLVWEKRDAESVKPMSAIKFMPTWVVVAVELAMLVIIVAFGILAVWFTAVAGC